MKWKKLNYKEIARGIILCHENVCRLLKSAANAFRSDFYPSAVMQSILAMEERGRKLILYSIHTGGTELDKGWWDVMFGDHRTKIASTVGEYFAQRKKRKWTRTLHKLGSQYQDLKEVAMYVSFDLKKDFWVHPGRISREKALVCFPKHTSLSRLQMRCFATRFAVWITEKLTFRSFISKPLRRQIFRTGEILR